MEYSAEAMEAAQNGLHHLRNQVRTLKNEAGQASDSGQVDTALREKFCAEINDDLNMPRAMAVVQDLLKSELSAPDKLATLYDIDRVLGFDLEQVDQEESLPEDIRRMADERLAARKARNWALSDQLRDAIQERGFWCRTPPRAPRSSNPKGYFALLRGDRL